MSRVSSDPFALSRIVVARADQLIETSLRRAGYSMRPGELRVLRFIAQGLQTPSSIRHALDGVTQQYVSKCLTELVNQGCVERRDDPADRRRIALQLTRKGRRAVALCDAWFDRLDQLTPDALEASAEDVLRGFDQLLDAHGGLHEEPVITTRAARQID